MGLGNILNVHLTRFANPLCSLYPLTVERGLTTRSGGSPPKTRSTNVPPSPSCPPKALCDKTLAHPDECPVPLDPPDDNGFAAELRAGYQRADRGQRISHTIHDSGLIADLEFS